MSDKKNHSKSMYCILLMVLLTVAYVATVRAQDRTWQSNDMNAQTAGDLSYDSNTLALGRSSFDVDINQCMGSTSWDTIIGGKQKLVINWVCLAEFYIKTGQPELAAMAICNTEMLTEFESEAECEAAHDFFVEVAEAAVMMVEDRDDEDYRELAQKLEELEARPPQVIERTVVQKEAWMTAEKRAALQEVLDE